MVKLKAAAEMRLRHVAEWLQTDSSVLDLGAGYGFGYQFLLSKNILITAVDLDSKRLSYIVNDRRVIVVNSEIEPFLSEQITSGKRYDTTILTELIEHIPLWQWHGLLSRILKISDRIIITTPYMQDQFRYLRQHLDQYRDPITHEPYIHKVFGITPEIFEVLGFKIGRTRLLDSLVKDKRTPLHPLKPKRGKWLMLELIC